MNRKLLATAALFAAALFPSIGQADLIIATAQAGQSFLLEDDAPVIDLAWGRTSSSSDERPLGREENSGSDNDHHRQPPRPEAVPDAADCCGTGTSTPTVDGPSTGSAGLVAENLDQVASGASGYVSHCEMLIPPNPVLSGLLDPPKNVA